MSAMGSADPSPTPGSTVETTEQKKRASPKDVYNYSAKFPLYSVGWSHRPGRQHRLAIGSIVEKYANVVCCGI